MGCGRSKDVRIDRAVNYRYLLLDFHAQRAPQAAVNPRWFPKGPNLKVVEVINRLIPHLPAQQRAPFRIHAKLILLQVTAELGFELNTFGGTAQHTRIFNGTDDVFLVETPEMNR